MNRISGIIIAVLAISGLAGLGSCRGLRMSQLFPDFAGQERGMKPVTIIADAIVVNGIRADSDMVDTRVAEGLGRYCLSLLTHRLAERGDTVERINLSSIGLLLPEKTYRVGSLDDALSGATGGMPVRQPPFMVDPYFARHPETLPLMRSVMVNVLNGEQYERKGPYRISDAGILARSLGAGTLAVLLIRGYVVQPAQEYGRLIEIPSPGFAATELARETSVYSVYLMIFRPEDGLVLWNDRVIRKGGTFRQDKYTSMIDELVGRMP